MLKYIFAIAICVIFVGCASSQKSDMIEIETPFGSMTVRLYDETPQHKANFIKLVSTGDYDMLLFHRVIEDFMIQGGDPASRNAHSGQQLGSGDIGEQIEAEIEFPKYYHKRGALAAARQPDNVNPERKSSGSQFYIVQGKTVTDEALDLIESRRNAKIQQQVFYRILPSYQDSLQYYQQNGMIEELSELQTRIMGLIVDEMSKIEGLFRFTEEQREVYKNIGGAPHLDGEYTVFGELVDGFDVLDSIAGVPTNPSTDRPIEDVWMKMKFVTE